MQQGLKTLVTVLVTAVIVGGAVYWWQQPIQVAVAPSYDSGKSFAQYFEDFREAETASMPQGFKRIYEAEGVVAPCPPNPDGPCGFSVFILGREGWEQKGVQEFYLEVETGGASRNVFAGPFTDDLKQIVAEAKLESAKTKK